MPIHSQTNKIKYQPSGTDKIRDSPSLAYAQLIDRSARHVMAKNGPSTQRCSNGVYNQEV